MNIKKAKKNQWKTRTSADVVACGNETGEARRDLNFCLVFSGRSTGAGEDGTTVPVRVLVGQTNGFIKRVGVEADHHGPKYFLGVTLHNIGKNVCIFVYATRGGHIYE